LIHFGTFWYILVHFGTFWYILVHFGTFWYILVHFGTFWWLWLGFEYSHREPIVFIKSVILEYLGISTIKYISGTKHSPRWRNRLCLRWMHCTGTSLPGLEQIEVRSKFRPLESRFARWYIYIPKVQIWVHFGGPWSEKCWYILCQFGIFYSLLV
jgi:hypothetical protein